MANPQKENGLTPIANELLDAIIMTHFSPTEYTIILVIIRKTYGWNKKTDRISYTQFEEATGISRRHISPALHGLIKRNIITRQGDNYNLEYGIQKDYELWENPPKIITKIGNEIVTENSNESLPKSVTIDKPQSLPLSPKSLPVSRGIITKIGNEIVTESVHTKDNKSIITKDNTKDIYILPEFINQELWEAFLEMRKKGRAPLTDYAKHLAIKKLIEFKNSGENCNEILEQAILNSWKGLWPLKNKNQLPQPTTPHKTGIIMVED